MVLPMSPAARASSSSLSSWVPGLNSSVLKRAEGRGRADLPGQPDRLGRHLRSAGRRRGSWAGSPARPVGRALLIDLPRLSGRRLQTEAVKAGKGCKRVAELVQRQGLDVILQVGRLARGIGLGEGAELAGRHGERAAAEQAYSRPMARRPDEAVGALVHGPGARDLEEPSGSAGGPAGSRPRPGARGPAARRVRAAAAPWPMPESCSSWGEPMAPPARITSRRAVTLASPASSRRSTPVARRPSRRTAQGLGVGQDPQVRALQDRAQEGLGRGPAHAALLVDLEVAAALVVAAVEVIGLGDAGLGRRVAEGVEDLPGDPQGPRPAIRRRRHALRRPAVEVLRAPEVRQDIVPAPAGVAELAPEVVVAGLAAHVDHAVDGEQPPSTRPRG